MNVSPFFYSAKPSLRCRLARLILLSLIPAVLGMAADAIFSLKEAFHTVQQVNTDLVLLAAATQQRQVATIGELLATVAAGVPRDGSGCARHVRLLLPHLPHITNLGLLSAQGRLVCSAIGSLEGTDYSQRDYFQEAALTHKLTVSSKTRGAVSGVQSLIFGYPVLKGNDLQGVVFATFNPRDFAQLPHAATLPAGVWLAYFDRHGNYIDSDPAFKPPVALTPAASLGRFFSPADHVQEIRWTSPRGDVYLSAVAPIRNAQGVIAYVASSTAEAEMVSGWLSASLRRAGAVLATLLAALGVGWLLLRRWLLADFMRLIAAASSPQVAPPPALRFHTREASAAMNAVLNMRQLLQTREATLLQHQEQLNERNIQLQKLVQERTDAAARQERMLMQLAETIPQMVWIFTSDEGVVYVNKAWQREVPDGEHHCLGHDWPQMFHQEDREQAVAAWRSAVTNGAEFTGQYRLRQSDGQHKHYILKAAPLLDDAGSPDVWIGVGTDVTDLKHHEQQLRDANEELESFSYSVSHDLKAPLKVIRGFSSVLLSDFGDELDVQAKHYLQRILANGDRMTNLIDDLLQVAQIAKMEAHAAQIDLARIADDVLASLRDEYPDSHVEVVTQAPLCAYGDPRLMRIVLDNLLGNAFKFTAGVAAPCIELGCETNPGTGELVYFVRDNGVGFDMRYADKLFGVFQRLHSTAEFPGTGVGLATVKRIISRHGGRVWAQSQPAVGTTFFFTLSAIESEAAHLALPITAA